MNQQTDTDALVQWLEGYYDFQCEGGPLKNCVEWQSLKDALADLRARLTTFQEHHVKMQQHRDAWRRYAKGRGPKPNDYLDGSLADREATALEQAEARLATTPIAPKED